MAEKTLRDLTLEELKTGLVEQKVRSYDIGVAIEQLQAEYQNARVAINAIVAEILRREGEADEK